MSSSASIQTSNLTLAYINTSNNISQLENNIKDLSNNIKSVNVVFDDILDTLNIKLADVPAYKSSLLDISNNF
jgi:hypothetical protein